MSSFSDDICRFQQTQILLALRPPLNAGTNVVPVPASKSTVPFM
jgi:hypothetical protein